MSEFIPFGAQFSENARIFGFTKYVNGGGTLLYDVLQIHDTYGLPFDLIYLKLSAETNHLSYQLPSGETKQLTSDEFSEVMEMVRYGAIQHGLFKSQSTR